MILADCGNTAVKLACGAERVRLQPETVAAWLERHPGGELLVLPGSAATSAVVRAAFRGPVRVVGPDLALPEVGQYATMGLDRIVAGLAAGARTIVVDAGTATTLTAWDDQGRFAGGLILPGPHAMVAGLLARAPALPQVEPSDSGARAAQFDTANAIAAGIGIGHAAMVVACLRRLQTETGIDRVVVTGGGAAGLLPGAEHRPWLVLEGLECLAGSRASARDGTIPEAGGPDSAQPDDAGRPVRR